MFDLSTIQQQDTATLEIVNPVTGDLTGWVIEFAGPSHPLTQKQRSAMLDKARRKKGDSDLSIEQLDNESADFIASKIVSWSGLSMDGKAAPFSKELAIKIFSNPAYSIVREQVNKFLLDEASFLKRPEKG